MPPLPPPIWAVETADHDTIAAIIEAAFGRPEEARLVETLRAADQVIGEWIATREETPVGHILASRAVLADNPDIGVACLAPLSVVPAEQKKGVGSALVRYALSELAVEAIELVFVLGDPAFWRRLGFDSELGHGFDTPWREAGEANMVLPLSAKGLLISGGKLEFAEALTHLGL